MRSRVLRIVLAAYLVFMADRIHAQEEAVVLAKDGISQAVVVVSNKATEEEKGAARDLAKVLLQVTGASFEVVARADRKKSRLLVGPDAARAVLKGFSYDILKKDGIVIRTKGKDLVLSGGRPRGTRNAVYTFLEEEVGCRWWSRDCEQIPFRPNLAFSQVDITYTPPFEMRRPNWGENSKEWALRNKSTGREVWPSGPVHSFEAFSKSSEFARHPEWFSEINGKRVRRHSQLCLTNSKMTKAFIRNVQHFLKQQKKLPKAVWISQNDWSGY